MRGVLDTFPADHSAGARVWFIKSRTGFAGLTDVNSYSLTDISLSAKLLPYTPNNTLAISSATQRTCTTSSRAWKPYPPGNVTVNNMYWPTTTVGNATLGWSHRHRVTQTSDQKMVTQDTGNYVSTPEGNYTVEVYIGGVLKQTYTGINGTSQVYTAAQRIADDPDGTKTTRLRIKPVNGSYVGTYRDKDFIMTGLGMTLGQYLGGQQE